MSTSQANTPNPRMTAANDTWGEAGKYYRLLGMHVISASGVAGDQVILEDGDGNIIRECLVSGSNFDKEYTIAAKWKGQITLATNTGNRATVELMLAVRGLQIDTVDT